MNVDTKKVRNTAMLENETAKKNLDLAKTQISQAISNIPESFTDAKQLQNYFNAIQPIIDKIKNLNGFIDGKAGTIDAANSVNTNPGSLNWAPGYQGGYPAGGYAGYGVLITDPKEALNQLKKTGATILNGLGAFSEGATEIVFGAGEKLYDIAGGVLATPGAALKDAFTKVTTGKWGNKTETVWKEINEKLAETSDIEWEHKLSHMRPESEKWEKQVYAPFRYGEMGYSGAKMGGAIFGAAFSPYAAVPGATAVTVGATGARFTPLAISTLSTGATSTARGTSEYLQTKKANSVEGIKEAYQTGQITKEQYKKLMKTATPEWNTNENTLKALGYGALTGAWEATQFVVGAAFLPTRVSSAAARVVTNTALNAADPVVRAGAKSLLDKTPFSKEFQAQGGIKSVVTSGLAGFGGSILGELARSRASKNVVKDNENQTIREYSLSEQNGVTDYTELDPDEMIERARGNLKKYWKGYVSEDKIDGYIDGKFIFYNEEEWQQTEFYKKSPDIMGMNVGETIHIRLENNPLIQDIVEHETNHSIGSIRRPGLKGIFEDIGMNEAATELFALEAAGLKDTQGTKYDFNVTRLRDVKYIVDQKVHSIPGYEDMDILKTSYSDNFMKENGNPQETLHYKELFDNALDDIVDREGFSEELRKQMSIADGGFLNDYSDEEIQEARLEVDALISELELKYIESKNSRDKIPEEIWKLID